MLSHRINTLSARPDAAGIRQMKTRWAGATTSGFCTNFGVHSFDHILDMAHKHSLDLGASHSWQATSGRSVRMARNSLKGL